jgi:hypothetical protein
MKKNPPTQEYCRLLSLELVFLWHALPTCTEEELKPFLDGIVLDYDTGNIMIEIPDYLLIY